MTKYFLFVVRVSLLIIIIILFLIDFIIFSIGNLILKLFLKIREKEDLILLANFEDQELSDRWIWSERNRIRIRARTGN